MPSSAAAGRIHVAVVAAPVFDPWQIRIRGVGVPGRQRRHKVTVGNAIIPELDISYYFTPNRAVEAICCFSKNSIYVSGLNSAVAQTWLFPPTVTAQYHFTNFGASSPISAPASTSPITSTTRPGTTSLAPRCTSTHPGDPRGGSVSIT
jgi:outer membrane protein